jgi:hypothetical protein
MEEINIEHGMPTVDVAMPLLTERLRAMKKSGVKGCEDHPLLRLTGNDTELSCHAACP